MFIFCLPFRVCTLVLVLDMYHFYGPREKQFIGIALIFHLSSEPMQRQQADGR